MSDAPQIAKCRRAGGGADLVGSMRQDKSDVVARRFSARNRLSALRFWQASEQPLAEIGWRCRQISLSHQGKTGWLAGGKAESWHVSY